VGLYVAMKAVVCSRCGVEIPPPTTEPPPAYVFCPACKEWVFKLMTNGRVDG